MYIKTGADKCSGFFYVGVECVRILKSKEKLAGTNNLVRKLPEGSMNAH
jgi:hypothetical protein